MTLFEIQKDFQDLQAEIIIADGEITPEMLDRLDSLSITADEKIKGYIVVYKEITAESAKYGAEARRLKNESDRLKNSAERLKERLKTGMETLNREMFDDVCGKITFRKSESVEIADNAILPSKYTSVEIIPDKVALKTAIKGGEVIEGVTLIKTRNINIK